MEIKWNEYTINITFRWNVNNELKINSNLFPYTVLLIRIRKLKYVEYDLLLIDIEIVMCITLVLNQCFLTNMCKPKVKPDV